jgi:hypothetical protein
MEKFNKIINIIFATTSIIFLVIIIYGISIKGLNYTAIIAILLDLLLATTAIKDLIKRGE